MAQRLAQRLFPERWAAYQRGAFARQRVEPLGIDDPQRDIAPSPEPVPGIDLRAGEQLQRLHRWAAFDLEFVSRIRSDLRINESTTPIEGIENGYYQTPDAEVYGCMLIECRPRRIIEVGGGYSTLIARHVVREARLDTELIVIDPDPRTDVTNACDLVIRQPVEASDLEDLALGSQDLLFIDSSHVVRAGGDLPYLYNRVVPALGSGAIVHVHDVYLPYPYAPLWALRLWTEQYLLQALLSGSPRYRVEFATHLMSRTQLHEMRSVFGSMVGQDARHFGQSFWFSVVKPVDGESSNGGAS